MENNLIQAISNYLGWEYPITLELAKKAPITYKKYEVRKKNGGVRKIYHPSKQTKALQYALIDIFLSKIPIHESALAYKKGLKSPLLKNATYHSPYQFTIRIDFKDYFPSIKPDDLINKIKSPIKMAPNREEISFITKALFVYNYKKQKYFLGIGSPSSPIISNIVMFDIDEKCFKYSQMNSAVYTRYADDIIYSASNKKDCIKFNKYLQEILKKIKLPSLRDK